MPQDIPILNQAIRGAAACMAECMQLCSSMLIVSPGQHSHKTGMGLVAHQRQVKQYKDNSPCRFIRKNFAVTSFPVDARMAHVLAWSISRHQLISFTLYTAGMSHAKTEIHLLLYIL